jgi:TolB-like protein/Tfp pilus assembly protein PilF
LASLIPGFEYDIFVSYRHNDNRSGWVADFVADLQQELSATIKEPISIYFDKNRHDGLLETHDVDRSLEEKLKCVIFVPILSQTYCDPKSFAWQKEFCVFNKLSQADSLGPGTKLSNGNFSRRILPVRIHELDDEDKTTIEKETGTPLRAIDFIFHAPGVNRPLTPGDKKEENLNKTFYRDQVNKIANAIKEIIHVYRQPVVSTGEAPRYVPVARKKSRRVLTITAALLLLIAITGYAGFYLFKDSFSPPGKKDLSIAILPFTNLSFDSSQQYFGDGVAEMIRTNLSKVKELRVTSMRSVMQYRHSEKTIPQIGSELNVAHVLEGTILKEGKAIRVIVQLIDAPNDRHIWSETYDRDLDQIFEIQSDIAQHIAGMLQLKLTEQDQQNVKAVPSTSLASYDLVLSGRYTLNELRGTQDRDDIDIAKNQFLKALQIDPSSLEAKLGLGWCYFNYAYYGDGTIWLDSAIAVAEEVLRKNPRLAEAYRLEGMCYYDKGEPDNALTSWEKALSLDPNDIAAMRRLAFVYKENRDFKRGVPLAIRAMRLDPGISSNTSAVSYQFDNLGYILFEAGYVDEAEQSWQQQAILYPKDKEGFWSLFMLKLLQGRRDEAVKILDEHLSPQTDEIKTDNVNSIDTYAWIYYLAGQYDKALPLLEMMLKMEKEGFKEGARTHIFRHRLAHILQMKGEIARSKALLKEHMDILEASVKQGKSRWGLEYDLSCTNAFLGNREKALEWLEKMPYEIQQYMFVQVDPLFDPIRNEARFKKVMLRFQAERNEIRKIIEMEEVREDLKTVLK